MLDQVADSRLENTMRERVSGSALKHWLLVEANRWALTTVLLGVSFVFLFVIGQLDPAPLQEAITSKDPIDTLFQALVTAIITGVTLVVTINQLVLSQELGAVGDQRDRMSGAIEFRRDIESHMDEEVSPANPTEFFQALLVAVRTNAESLSETIDATTNPELSGELEAFTEELSTNADEVARDLEAAEFGTFEMMSAVFNFNYSLKIYELRRIRANYDLPQDADTLVDELLEVLEFIGPSREHFKTLYFQWELVNLSRALLYTAVPALLTAVSMVLFFDNPGSLPGTTFGVENILWGACLATTITIVPFIILISFILRIATMAKRTLAIGPLILRKRENDTTDSEN